MKLRKLFAAGLALVMTLAMAAPTMAAEITVENGKKNETYTAYKIFDYTKSGDNFSYTMPASSEWKQIVDDYADADGNDVFTLTPSKNDANVLVVTINKKAETSLFATEADATAFAAYLSGKIPAAFAADSLVKPVSGKADASGKVTLDGLGAGYYFVDTSLGAMCSLFNNDTTQKLEEKNSVPTLVKTADKTTASIGDTITYTITVTNGEGVDKNITVHDKMEAGLTLDTGSIKVDGVAYTYVKPTDGCTFEVVLNGANYEKNAQIVITYTATLNENAEIAPETNDNTAWLTYSEQTSAVSTVSVKTFEFDLVKTDKDAKLLPGAQFKLYDAATNGNEIKVIKNADGTYRVAVDGEAGVVIEAGNVTIKGLGNGTYYLEETVAPQGYNPLTERAEFKIENANKKAVMNAENAELYQDGGVQVINQTGLVLPSTGGMGTTLFYIVGGLMVVCAGVVLVTKKRMGNK